MEKPCYSFRPSCFLVLCEILAFRELDNHIHILWYRRYASAIHIKQQFLGRQVL